MTTHPEARERLAKQHEEHGNLMAAAILRGDVEGVNLSDETLMSLTALSQVLQERDDAVSSRQVIFANWHKIISAVIPPQPMCLDCADNDGTCPHSGLPCDTTEEIIERFKRQSNALREARATLLDLERQAETRSELDHDRITKLTEALKPFAAACQNQIMHALRQLAERWTAEQVVYPNHNTGLASAAAVRCCVKELMAVIELENMDPGKTVDVLVGTNDFNVSAEDMSAEWPKLIARVDGIFTDANGYPVSPPDSDSMHTVVSAPGHPERLGQWVISRNGGVTVYSHNGIVISEETYKRIWGGAQ